MGVMYAEGQFCLLKLMGENEQYKGILPPS
jgi:hypothetical protein